MYAGILTYIFLIFGLYYFINRVNATAKDAFILGLTIYAVYELTNMTLFTNWTIMISLIDIIWGGILFYLTTVLSRG
jgi:uncharacterized membrane protein